MGAERQARIEAALEHAAAVLGDVIPLIMAEFYRLHPEARESFAYHAPDQPDRLEAEMVDNALYCLMTWCERRAEVEIILQTSAPHHADTLHVPVAWYAGLLDAAVSVLGATARDAAEAALWQDLRAELHAAVLAAAY